MAAYARIYGFFVFESQEIAGKEEFYIEIGENCFISNGDYAMLEEILNENI